jgi:hypothetical protein
MPAKRHWSLFGAVMALVIFALVIFAAGCSAGDSIVNNNIPPVNNLLNVDNQQVTATVNGSRATISGNASGSATFGDRSLPQQGLLKFVKFSQAIDDGVTATVPSSATKPDSFQLKNITLAISVSDGTGATLRTASAQANVSGPITYVRVSGTDQYTALSHLSFSDIQISGDSFTTFRDIVTSPPSPNTATARLSFDTDDQALPNGSTITFRFVSGQARVGI